MTDPGQSAEELFGEALELPLERRAAFLDQACRNAPEIRRRVEQLLEQDKQAALSTRSTGRVFEVAFAPRDRCARVEIEDNMAGADGHFGQNAFGTVDLAAG